MAQPTILPEGATPVRTDTRWRTLVKTVGAAFNAATAPSATDAPAANDTRAKLLRKWDRLLNS